MPNKYIHLPTEIEAIKLTPETFKQVLEFLGASNIAEYSTDECSISLNSEEDNREVHNTDYIIKGVLGKVYPCSREVFEVSYKIQE